MAERIWVFDMPPDPLGLLICWLRNHPVVPAAIEKKMGMLTTERNRDRGSVSRTEKTTPIIKQRTNGNPSLPLARLMSDPTNNPPQSTASDIHNGMPKNFAPDERLRFFSETLDTNIHVTDLS